MDIAVVLLAAGQGTRMKSAHPKVLHNLCGKAMVSYIAEAAAAIKPTSFVAVVSPYSAASVRAELPSKTKIIVQDQPLGTGHAVQTAEPALAGFVGTVLVLCGDTPLITGQTLKSLVKAHKDRQAAATVLTAKVDDPHGYGRIIRGNGGVKRIVEECDADPTESVIREVNTGTYCFDGAKLFAALHKIEPTNSQKEHYLTDVIEVFFKDNEKVAAFQVEDSMETLGVNSRVQLADAEMIMQARLNREHMMRGVTLIHPMLTYIDATVSIGKDTVIYPNTFLTGKTTIGEGCLLGPSCQIVDSRIGNNCEITFSVVRESRLASGITIGPFANVRPGCKIDMNGKVGSFVEIKASEVGIDSKVPHLSYIGDTTIGQDVNVGAGTITCNFDGLRKHHTIIEDNAFIGSDTILVAPVRVGKGAYTGAGSTITKDVPDGGLGIERSEQRNLDRKSSKK